MLIVFPIGLWIFSFVCDLIYFAGTHNPVWQGVAFYSMVGGLVGALLAAIPGFIDYLSMSDPVTRRIATIHMVLNLIVVALFIFNLGVRYNAQPSSEILGTILSAVGIAFMGVSGWLGGALVFERRVGVSTTREEQRVIERRAA